MECLYCHSIHWHQRPYYLRTCHPCTFISRIVNGYTYTYGSKVAEAEANRLLRKGIKAEANGNYEEALTFYKKIVTAYPGTSQAEDAQSCIISLQKREV